jgi:hypothetical protein
LVPKPDLLALREFNGSFCLLPNCCLLPNALPSEVLFPDLTPDSLKPEMEDSQSTTKFNPLPLSETHPWTDVPGPFAVMALFKLARNATTDDSILTIPLMLAAPNARLLNAETELLTLVKNATDKASASPLARSTDEFNELLDPSMLSGLELALPSGIKLELALETSNLPSDFLKLALLLDL